MSTSLLGFLKYDGSEISSQDFNDLFDAFYNNIDSDSEDFVGFSDDQILPDEPIPASLVDTAFRFNVSGVLANLPPLGTSFNDGRLAYTSFQFMVDVDNCVLDSFEFTALDDFSSDPLDKKIHVMFFRRGRPIKSGASDINLVFDIGVGHREYLDLPEQISIDAEDQVVLKAGDMIYFFNHSGKVGLIDARLRQV